MPNLYQLTNDYRIVRSKTAKSSFPQKINFATSQDRVNTGSSLAALVIVIPYDWTLDPLRGKFLYVLISVYVHT